eukprot:scaffold14355_cov105-Isochrysis_galbana.AAC.4
MQACSSTHVNLSGTISPSSSVATCWCEGTSTLACSTSVPRCRASSRRSRSPASWAAIIRGAGVRMPPPSQAGGPAPKATALQRSITNCIANQ